jgi:mono/diheme cytochrome c family protein
MIGHCFSRMLPTMMCAAAVVFASRISAQQPVALAEPKPQGILITNSPPLLTVQPAQPTPSPTALTNLVFDAETKEFHAKAGDTEANFVFHFKNASDVPVHVLSVRASCGCTTAKLPAMPWVISAGTNDELSAKMTLAGKPPGETTKTLTIQSTNGTKILFVKVIIPAPSQAGMTASDRAKNQELAKADRQAVFKNDCASCHVTPTVGKMGKELYTTACGICHDSEHRASMVPDIAALNRPPDTNYWRTTIADGVSKPGSLMPAFSQDHGGPLTKAQIDSLVAYMITDFPREHKPTVQIKPPTAIPAPSNQPPRAAISPAPPLPPGIPGQAQVSFPTVQPVKK